MSRRLGLILKFQFAYPKGERGMALVTALLILVALTMMGISAMTNTTIDTMISGNDFMSQQRFYAAEGAVELALASVPGLVSGEIKNSDGETIDHVNDLLVYDDGDGKIGNITPLINTLLEKEDINDQFNPNTERMSFSIVIKDNDLYTVDENGDPMVDSDDRFILTSNLNKWNGEVLECPIEETEIFIKHLKIDQSGAATLIDNNASIVVDLAHRAKIIGGTVDGIATTDALIDIHYNKESYNGESAENFIPDDILDGVLADDDLKPAIDELQRLKEHLTEPLTLSEQYTGGDSSTPIIIDETALAAMEIDPLDPTSILYLRGYFELKADYLGIIIIDDYINQEQSDSDAACGLIIDHESVVEGLVLLLPRVPDLPGTRKLTVEIKLEDGAAINGMVVASSMPYGQGVKLDLAEGASVNYSAAKYEATHISQRGYVVEKWSYLSRVHSDEHE